MKNTYKKLIIRLAAMSLAWVSAHSLATQVSESYTTAKRYNLNGQVTGVIGADPDGAGPLRHPATRNTYGATSGHLQRVEHGYLTLWQDESVKPEHWPSSVFRIASVKRYTYDDLGNRLTERHTDSSGKTHRFIEYSYDAYGRLLCKAVRMNPANYGYAYSAHHVCRTGSEGQYGPDRITKYEYDKFDNILKEIRAVGTDIELTHVERVYEDEGTLLRTVTDANGNTTKYNYDEFGRLEYWYFPSKTKGSGSYDTTDYEKYSYDNNGNRTALRKRDGKVIHYGYDGLNRLIKKDIPGTTAQDVYYGYDNRGFETYARFASHTGKGVTTSYNGFGEINKETTTVGTTSYAISHRYDLNGNRTRVTHPDGQFFTYQYDDLDRLSAIKERDSQVLIQEKYDNFARPKNSVTAGNVVTTLAYDGISRLNGIDHNVSGNSYDLKQGFSHNPANQLVSQSLSNSHYKYSGNGGRTGSYAVNGLNQYVDVTGSELRYDDNGNLTFDGDFTYAYDVENRLTSAQKHLANAFTYDPKGRLYLHERSGDSVYFLYDGDSLIAEYAQGRMVRRYVHSNGTDVPVVSYEGSGLGGAGRQFLHRNHQGSVVAATDSAGYVEYVNAYDEYGVSRAGNQGRFGYTGQMSFSDLGFYHYRARAYSPKLGRFMQTDPVGYEDQMNLYAYVHNDPLNYTDPTGEYGITGTANVGPALQEACGGSADCVAEVGSQMVQAADTASDFANPVKGLTKAAVKQAIKKGAADGARAGKKHTRGAINKAKETNAAQNGGKVKCTNCGRETTPGTQRTKGSKVNPREGQGDHIHPRSKGGDGATVKDQRNIDIKCAECNLNKRDNLP